MKREEILTLYHSNPDSIASYIEDFELIYKALEFRYKVIESQNIEFQERINELESLLNQNIQSWNILFFSSTPCRTEAVESARKKK